MAINGRIEEEIVEEKTKLSIWKGLIFVVKSSRGNSLRLYIFHIKYNQT